MRKKICLYLILFFLLLIPTCVLGKEDSVVARTVKYYKTTTTYNTSDVLLNTSSSIISSIVTEISEEEYNNVKENNEIIKPYGTEVAAGTSYERLETVISKYNSLYYIYKAILTWKTIPTYRGYDIMGIGYYASVKATALNYFKQDYCNVDGNCYTNSGYYSYMGNNGIGALFILPSGTLKSLSATLEVYVEKTDKNSTVVSQVATGDYAHNVEKISYSDAKDFYIGSLGITLREKTVGHYDEYPHAMATWSGKW